MADTNPAASHRPTFKRFLAPLAILVAASAGTAVFWLTGGACFELDNQTNQPLGIRSRGDCTEICPELADAVNEGEAEASATSGGQTAELPTIEHTALRSGLPPGMGQAARGDGTTHGLGPGVPNGNLTR